MSNSATDSGSSSDPAIDPGDFRNVLGHFPTGVTVVTAAGTDRPVGVAIGSFVSISLDPPLVGFFLGTQSGSWPPLRDTGHFCVNVLCHDQIELCGTMASKADDKFDGVDYTAAPGSGAPILPDVHAAIDCRIADVVEAGDHNLIIGRVLSLETLRDAPPMVFYKGQYGSFGG
jgi:flavin reductase (DIM6/NTAB) family NADH-FMN oxidoreductase RutF